MSEATKIEWADMTWNPWRGCTKVSPGCAHCYAETLSLRNPGTLGEWGAGARRVRGAPKYLSLPLVWDELARRGRFVECHVCGRREFRKLDGTGLGLACCSTDGCVSLPETESSPVRPRVFCLSLGDWLDDEAPIEWLAHLLETIRLTPHLDWLLLTKRPGNWVGRLTDALKHAEGIQGDWPEGDPESLLGGMLNAWLAGEAPANVWLGASVEDQARADARVPLLLGIPAKVRFLSCEPLLGAVDLLNTCGDAPFGRFDGEGEPDIHWVIVGGESGPNARPMHPDWARSLRDQCVAAGVAYFFKQWGEWVYPGLAEPQACFEEFPTAARAEVWTDWRHDEAGVKSRRGYDVLRLGKKRAGRLLDGEEWSEGPWGKGGAR